MTVDFGLFGSSRSRDEKLTMCDMSPPRVDGFGQYREVSIYSLSTPCHFVKILSGGRISCRFDDSILGAIAKKRFARKSAAD
jgi:hypothetical protein